MQPEQKQQHTQHKNHENILIQQQRMRKKRQLQQKARQLGMTKSQLKKQQKKQKWQQTKLSKRQQKRQKQRQKRKMNKIILNEHKKQQPQQKNKQKQLENQQIQQNHLQIRRRKDQYKQKMQDNLKVVIDLQFYDLMVQKQLNSLVKQLSYCHSINRKMQKPFNYILTSVTQPRASYIDQKYNGKKWGITFLQPPVHQSFNLQNLVYLTGDAQDQLSQFSPQKIYIIGGIVDHNRLKKITYNYAKQHNIQMKRLPLKNIKLKTNVHLAVNHVWEWMLRQYNGQSWDQALGKVLPQRKIEKIEE